MINLESVRTLLEDGRTRLSDQLMLLSSQGYDGRREDSPFGKREETADHSLEMEKRVALIQRVKGALTEVEHALEKLEQGTYGLCDCCGKPIPPARLEAIPDASLCLDCKAKQCKTAAREPKFKS